MERIIKTYESFSYSPENLGDEMDIIRFDAGDEKKLSALAKALDHSIDLVNPDWGKKYLDKGPIYVINSKYYYQPSNGKLVSDGSGKGIPFDVLVDEVGDQILTLDSGDI